ncbi:PREDICTED: peroxisomal acyl-coenzyme A oxidase 3-like [Papilio polytes]|uniref:peroxisomal acyl-coenzyme A oxidase 3-like n=1 Tax=Papilio polytes TaxID=76194 RepID=UPI0006761FAC|nr:PREDICTED: peroxisomal acyl-coenzyme A oxidase 3-like [Papilio polytes]
MVTLNNKGVTDDQLKELFPDLPAGPLDVYRKKATFDWRRMKLVYDNLSTMKMKNDIWNYMLENPLFRHQEATPSLDEQRHIATKRMYAIFSQNFTPLIKIGAEPRLFQSETEALFMFDSSLAVKISLTFRMFSNVIQGSGRSHHYKYIEQVESGKIGGCFALTEVAHGSNAKGMRTTATYCPEKKQFIMHTPDFEAAKFWVGSLGKCATHAIVYAMLISKGKNHGLHTFVVPIRDPKTLKPYPGVTVGDIGEKIGLNGIDNGFVMFNNYRLPKEAALDKMGGVDDNGDYQTPFRDPKKRFGASLGILSGGRVHITSISANYLQKAIVIAIRYSAVRRQFGPENSTEELPVLEYQQQQVRLLPYLATTFALRVFCTWFGAVHVAMAVDNITGIFTISPRYTPPLRSSGIYPSSALGELRNDNDANCTYEGENSLLLQQASNWLLQLWPRRAQLAPADHPLASLAFLPAADRTIATTCPWTKLEDIIEPANLIEMFKWLTVYTLKTTYEKVSSLKGAGRDNFQAKNESQSYHATSLSVVYGENFILNNFYKSALEFHDAECRKVLLQMVALYGAFLLEKHLATLYIGGYLAGAQGALVREGVVRLCAQLAAAAPALADTLAPPDWCLNSVLGHADGEVYKHLQNNVLTYPGAVARPAWWRDVVHWQTYAPSKL